MLSILDKLPSFSSKKERRVIFFYIGTLSVSGALIEFRRGERPHVLYSLERTTSSFENLDIGNFLVKIKEMLSSVAVELRREGFQKKRGSARVDEVFCVLSSAWHNTQTTTASYKSDKPFDVTETLMDSLLSQIHKENDRKDEEEGYGGGEAETIEEVVINSTLNGYSTRNPEGKKATHMSVTTLESRVKKDFYTAVLSTLDEVFHTDELPTFRSGTLVAFTVIRDLFNEIRDFLIVDVTSETTGVSVVRNGILQDTFSFPYGTNTVVRNIGAQRGGVPEEALSRIKLSFSHTEEDKAFAEMMHKEEGKWMELFGKVSEEISSEAPSLPNDAFLITNVYFRNWFQSMLERVDFSQFTAIKEPFRAHFFASKEVDALLASSVSNDLNVFIAAAALFYRKTCMD